MRSVLLQDYDALHHHAPAWYKRHPWFERFWQGAWVTDSGHMIRGWVDEVHADDVRRERASMPILHDRDHAPPKR